MVETINKIHNNFMDFIKLHFEPYEDMYSYVILGCKRKNMLLFQKDGTPKIGLYNFKYIRTDEINDNNKTILDMSKTIQNNIDYYITSNGFVNPTQRDTRHIFTLHNIVIDIDCHNSKLTKEQLNHMVDACEYFLQDLFDNPNFPTPNTLVRTGRGIQLWWAIEPITYRLRYMYDLVRDGLIKDIEELLSNITTLSEMKIDKAASRNYAGFFRIPGSINTKTRHKTTFEIINTEKLDVMEEYFAERPLPSKRRVTRVESENSKKYVGNKFNLLRHRENMLHNLLELRGYGTENGYRDLMLLILYNAYLSTGKSFDEAWDAIVELNDKFIYPLPEKEMKQYMSTSKRKKYKFTNKRIIEMLDMNEYECEYLNFHECTKQKIDYEEKRKEKRDRNKEIEKLLIQGKTQQEIAQIVNCSQATVSRICKKVMTNSNNISKKVVGLEA